MFSPLVALCCFSVDAMAEATHTTHRALRTPVCMEFLNVMILPLGHCKATFQFSEFCILAFYLSLHTNYSLRFTQSANCNFITATEQKSAPSPTHSLRRPECFCSGVKRTFLSNSHSRSTVQNKLSLAPYPRTKSIDFICFAICWKCLCFIRYILTSVESLFEKYAFPFNFRIPSIQRIESYCLISQILLACSDYVRAPRAHSRSVTLRMSQTGRSRKYKCR